MELPFPPGNFAEIEFATPEVGVWGGNGGAWVTHDAGESRFFVEIVPLEQNSQINEVVVAE